MAPSRTHKPSFTLNVPKLKFLTHPNEWYPLVAHLRKIDMKHTIQSTIAASLLAALTACGASNSPLTIEKKMSPSPWGTDVPVLTITSKVDQLKLTGLIINRGNCTWGASQKTPPADMVFGRPLTFVAMGCQIEEVQLKTDQGDFTFTF